MSLYVSIVLILYVLGFIWFVHKEGVPFGFALLWPFVIQFLGLSRLNCEREYDDLLHRNRQMKKQLEFARLSMAQTGGFTSSHVIKRHIAEKLNELDEMMDQS